MNHLDNQKLAHLPHDLHTPGYDRADLRPGIVHIGVGHFHRAHQAMYLDRLFEAGLDQDWAIWGVTMRPLAQDNPFAAQDHLYTLTEKHSDGSRVSRVIGSIIGFESAHDSTESVLNRIASPSTRIVSLTITEGGYGIDPATGTFTGAGDRLIAHDMAHPGDSQSWLGLLLNALRLRRDRDAGRITLLSCDNIQDNGKVAERALKSFAAQAGPDMLDWIDENMTFPGSMVDRVVPATTDADRTYLASRFNLEDGWAVTCEPFTQWTIEDNFANGRPPLDKVGVDLVPDVAPYERMKLRLANGVHQGLCFFGRLLNYRYVHEAIDDPDIHSFLIRYIDEEAVPSLTPIDGVDFTAWGREVLTRFANPQLQDPIARICAETSDRIPKFVLPVVTDRLRAEGSVEVCAAIVAAWARYAQGKDEHGATMEVIDPRRESVIRAAQAERETPGAFLQMREVFGDLGNSPDFVKHFISVRESLNSIGARATLLNLVQRKRAAIA
ncbi:mannitol dehydrogenase family protein [Arthrobacter sp. AZCC_0090]|uniref:mannitol dehydrogenase family protein n=1 Tax=Arthrobacter sp. AZCC_0090 TaxID=2735881 RepID=UPI00160F6EE7|nr:mannitol dehydrogenase family protein [Arthrobacter sp. AZCC_0090]MBB6407293.1 mannitol 2-dehydrogenase [Arthrobacter sp. AZCC_0090]